MKSSEQIVHQPPWMRFRYQGISSGILPDQMIRNSAKRQVDVQHHEGEASLPRSCCSVTRSIDFIGS